MEYFDFSACEYIKERMQFYTYYDFCNNRRRIKIEFDRLDKHAKMFYKWYVYANVHMDESFKNKIWNYLNDYEKSESDLLCATVFYKVK